MALPAELVNGIILEYTTNYLIPCPNISPHNKILIIIRLVIERGIGGVGGGNIWFLYQVYIM